MFKKFLRYIFSPEYKILESRIKKLNLLNDDLRDSYNHICLENRRVHKNNKELNAECYQLRISHNALLDLKNVESQKVKELESKIKRIQAFIKIARDDIGKTCKTAGPRAFEKYDRYMEVEK